jgi:predicted ribosome-associated RNA-binding protein Tma20
MLWKKDRDKVEKRELEKMSEKSVEQKKRGWALKIAHDLNHLIWREHLW